MYSEAFFTILQFALFLAILDTILGNYIFPGKVYVYKYLRCDSTKCFYVIKFNRYFFIPVREYLIVESRLLIAFSSDFFDKILMIEEDAVEIAKKFSNQKSTYTFSEQKREEGKYSLKVWPSDKE